MGRPRTPTMWGNFKGDYIAELKHGTTVISEKSLELVSNYRWFTKHDKQNNKYYVYTHYEKDKKLLLHRIICDAKIGQFVDHINGDTLDNRVENLRLCSKLENNRNVKKRKNCRSLYKGVTLRPSGRWGVYIKTTDKNICLGTFDKETDAAEAYNLAAKKYFGKFAKLNNIGEKND